MRQRGSGSSGRRAISPASRSKRSKDSEIDCARHRLPGAVGQAQAGLDLGEQPQRLDADRIDRHGPLQVIAGALRLALEGAERRAGDESVEVVGIARQRAPREAGRLLGVAQRQRMARGQAQELGILR
jgi:hypothetical protein